MNVIVINTGRGPIRVHRAGCADAVRDHATAEVTWTLDASTVAEVTWSIYPPDDFGYEPAAWNDFTGDVQVLPCADALSWDAAPDATNQPNDIADLYDGTPFPT